MEEEQHADNTNTQNTPQEATGGGGDNAGKTHIVIRRTGSGSGNSPNNRTDVDATTAAATGDQRKENSSKRSNHSSRQEERQPRHEESTPEDPTLTPPNEDAEFFSREEETELHQLSARKKDTLNSEEKARLHFLQSKYEVFIQKGEKRLREGINQREREEDPGLTATAVETAKSVGGTVAHTATAVGNGVFFWGSLVATAVPGFFGKRMGYQFDHWNWVSNKLILGALPVITEVSGSGNHLVKLGKQCEERKCKIGLVISCVLMEEMSGYGVGAVKFARKEDWEKYLGVQRYIHLPIPDFSAKISYDSVRDAVEAIHNTMLEGDVVYVHCKAGKGRSWMVVACYMMTFGGMTLQDAQCALQSARPQVHPSASQIRFAAAFACRYRPSETDFMRLVDISTVEGESGAN